MKSAQVKILNHLGLHARPASKLVKIASTGNSEVFLVKDGKRVNGRSILGLILLEAEQGSRVTIEVSGEDEEQVLARIVELVQNKFGED